ncbi:hypothetical protein DACRYDRAFT_45380 [Dacryopinax primogenitus]|uniref:Mitotic-spindle organizing protein 1 n=1 Tax=Dacryopinax primogenitus (strain DJM 731) TaxID=1858805 RepID=M5GBQ0_DACPD|nr:uncharacterized protein DACRYDRAFT_45380 [Dacryopinax primogenitus]EJU06409.1 hypothetical protein DACRYDRAFT_45380 [Dacryopinax primogenitus]
MSSREDRLSSAQQTLDTLFDLSQLLNTGLDRETLATCVELIERGTNPEALAAVVQEMRKEKAGLARES